MSQNVREVWTDGTETSATDVLSSKKKLTTALWGGGGGGGNPIPTLVRPRVK